jgi:hypothetical protein
MCIQMTQATILKAKKTKEGIVDEGIQRLVQMLVLLEQ